MNKIQKEQVLKQHELEKPTYSWCEMCGQWRLISMQGWHICMKPKTTPVRPWKEVSEDDRLDKPGLPD